MPAALLTMEEHNYLMSDLSAMRDSFGSDSLSGLHPSWLDDEQLNSLPMIDDAFADVSTPTARNSDAGSKVIAATANDHTERSAAVLIDAAGEHDQHFLDGALEFSFDQELSPILEPFAATASLFDDDKKDDGVIAKAAIAFDTPKRKRRQAKSPRTRQTAASPVRHVPHLSISTPTSQLDNDVFSSLEAVAAFPSPLAVSKRPRTRSSSLPWTKQEQNSFFSIFKAKWPLAAAGESEPPFSSLLLQRFDAISTKVKTKSVMEVRLFYTTVMRHIAELLQDVVHDIDLTNPDQVRIAVWCWSKLMADETHSEEFQTLDSEPSSVKTRLANVLLQSIIRSRRQMLKAKTDFTNNSAPQGSTKSQSNSTARAKTSNDGVTSISSWVSRSNLSSFFAQANIPVPENPTVHVHHPMVRKKHPAKRDGTFVENANEVLSSPSVQQPVAASARGKSLKRKRDWVADRTANEVSKTPVEKRKRLTVVESTPFTSPSPSDKRTRAGARSDVTFQTPQLISRKKFYIKMRMVPLDKQTKANVVRCGCRPKVELKLSSTKKISEVAAHMSKKWAKVLPILPAGAALRFFQKNRTIDSTLGSSGWSKEDSGVTCFDIWKQFGKQSKGENVVEISYLWKAPDSPTHSYPAGDSGLQELMPLQAPPGLFEREVAAATQQTIADARDETELKQTSPVHSLQEFGEKVAFDRSISVASEKDAALLTDVGSTGDDTASLAALIGDYVDDDLDEEYSPNTGRLRRRIKPTLVAKEEFNI